MTRSRVREIAVRSGLTVAVPVAALALVAGCGGDDDGAAAQPPSPIYLALSKNGNEYELSSPATVEAGLVEISLQVDTPQDEEHEAQFVRVEDDHTLDEALEAVTSEDGATPSWLFAAGGVGSTKGNMTVGVTQVLEPGTYYVLDLGEGDGDDVPSYAEQGATATIEVTGDAGEAELPETDATVTTIEYGFETTGLAVGRNLIRFDNAGEELHHIVAVPYEPGATAEQVAEFATSDAPPDGSPPVDFARASVTAVLEGGDSQVAELFLDAGKYAFLCFVSDRAGGPPHAAKGMIDEVVVG
jgi:hypothetical protein